jgi:hypothetical protein
MHFSAKRGFMCIEKSFSPAVGSFENANAAKINERKYVRKTIGLECYRCLSHQQFSNDAFSLKISST